MDYRTLSHLMKEAAEYGIKAALVETGQISPYLSKMQAYKLYGRGLVNRWVKEGLVKPTRDGAGSKWRYDRRELELVARTNNVATFLTNKKDNENR